jgi:hypothetical protein
MYRVGSQGIIGCVSGSDSTTAVVVKAFPEKNSLIGLATSLTRQASPYTIDFTYGINTHDRKIVQAAEWAAVLDRN